MSLQPKPERTTQQRSITFIRPLKQADRQTLITGRTRLI